MPGEQQRNDSTNESKETSRRAPARPLWLGQIEQQQFGRLTLTYLHRWFF